MKKMLLLFLLILQRIDANAQKFVPVDSTAEILKEWIAVISDEKYMKHLIVRGQAQELSLNLKLINLSLEDYQKGKYQYAFEDINEVKKMNNIPEVMRIKLFMLTMTEIKLNKRFKARKWYYVSKNKMTIASFGRLQRNVENQKLLYEIDNYKGVRGARITALGIGAGVLGIMGAATGSE